MKFKGKIIYTMDAEHPDKKYVEDWTEEKVFTYSDTYAFNSDYTEEEAIIYIKHDLKLVAGGGYNTDHIHNGKKSTRRRHGNARQNVHII